MTVVQETLVLPGGDPAAFAVITVQLVGPDGAAFVPPDETIVATEKIRANVDGEWSIDLVPNSEIIPEGTTWRRTVTAARSIRQAVADDYLLVPDSVAPVEVQDILVDPPGPVPSAPLASHIVDQGEGSHLPDGGAEGEVPTIIGGEVVWGPQSGAVASVNGETGVVSLSAADVGAATAAQGATADSAGAAIFAHVASGGHGAVNITVADSGGNFDATNAETVAAELHVRVRGYRPVNVLDQANRLLNAVGDGGPHPLSERFASLAAAQAVFPRATSLTEQIDRHAIQRALDVYPAVDLGPGTHRTDATVYGADDTVSQGLDGQTLSGRGIDISVIKPIDGAVAFHILWSGNARAASNANEPSANAPAARGNTWKRFTIDGNEAELSGSTGRGLTLYHQNDRRIIDVRIHSTKGGGIRDCGVNDDQTYDGRYRGVIVEDTGGNGLQISLRNRDCDVSGLVVRRNASAGLYLDASQNTARNIVATENGEHGIVNTGNFRNKLEQLEAWNNEQHGIYISGANEMVGSDWVSYANSLAADNTYDDIHFSGTNHGTYGINRRHAITGIQAGPSTHVTEQGASRYGIYFDDAVTACGLRQVQVITGMTGLVRLPAGAAHGVLVELIDGSQIADVVSATGATETLAWGGIHRVTMDQNCVFSFGTAPASGIFASMTVIISGAFTPTWPGSVDWHGGVAPTYASPAVYEFCTVDGGTTVFGGLVGSAFA